MRELLVTSIGASMQLAIGRPIIWGRTLQLVWDNIRHILKPLLGSWAEFRCSVTSIVALLQGEAALLPQMLLRCNWKWAGLAYDAEQSNLFGTMSSACWNCYLEVEPTCGFVATGPFLSPQFSLFSRESCFDISTAASMHLAIGSPNIWGRTVQFVRDNVKRILRLLLGSWANLWLCLNRTFL